MRSHRFAATFFGTFVSASIAAAGGGAGHPRPVFDIEIDPSQVALWAAPFGDQLAVSDHPSRMFFTRGTPESTREVATPLPAGTAMDLDEAVELNGGLLYTACVVDAGLVVWTDGTEAGTRVLLTNPGTVHTHAPTILTRSGSLAFFNIHSQHSPSTGLWRTDGTSEGTFLISNVGLGSMKEFNSGVLGVGRTSMSNQGLWQSDGTSGGTMPVLGAPVSVGSIALCATRLFLAGINSDDDRALAAWAWDPGQPHVRVSTSAMTGVLTLFAPSPHPGTALVGLRSNGLWRIDGTAAGARALFSGPGEFWGTKNAGERVCTLHWNGSENELWSTDLTPEGTVLVSRINPTGDDNIGTMVSAGSRVYFPANDGVHGRELWVTDGTAAGTRMAADVRQGRSSSMTSSSGLVVPVRNRLYFQALSGIPRKNLWVLDLRPADYDNSGTVAVQDVLDFVGDYLAGVDRADADGDGAVGMNDLFDWLGAFFADSGS